MSTLNKTRHRHGPFDATDQDETTQQTTTFLLRVKRRRKRTSCFCIQQVARACEALCINGILFPSLATRMGTELQMEKMQSNDINESCDSSSEFPAIHLLALARKELPLPFLMFNGQSTQQSGNNNLFRKSQQTNHFVAIMSELVQNGVSAGLHAQHRQEPTIRV